MFKTKNSLAVLYHDFDRGNIYQAVIVRLSKHKQFGSHSNSLMRFL